MHGYDITLQNENLKKKIFLVYEGYCVIGRH
jgi:hypothetical protein